MQDYLLVFRNDPALMPERTPENGAAMMQRWMDWIKGIAEKGNLVDRGNRLEHTGKVLRPGNVVTDGPYVEIKETIGGYTMIKANSYDEAIELSKGCPIFNVGGHVEIRQVGAM